MDIKRKSVMDIARTADRVVKLERKGVFAAGSIPMTDVFIVAPRVIRKSARFTLGISTRAVAFSLILLMVALPMSPVFAAEVAVGDAEADLEIERLPVSSESEAEGEIGNSEGDEAAGVEEKLSGVSSQESVVSDEDESGGVENEEGSMEDDVSAETVENEKGNMEEEAGTETVENEEGSTKDEEPEDGDVVLDEPSEPDLEIERLPVPSESEGEIGNSEGDEEDDVIEPPTEEELYEQLKAKVYDEVIAELDIQIKAFETEKRRLEDGCLKYEDGSFFCLNPEREDGPNSPSKGGGGTVYVQKDKIEGDGEIWFLSNDSKTPIRITDDKYDDQFPALDISGRSMVWQSFVNDRWQIKYRDMETGAVEQLTSSLYNSMNPAVSGDLVVWQAWPSDNWEIFLARRQAGGWSVEQLTQTETHDMFPKVAGGFVTWQSNDGESWQVFAYEIATGNTTQLSTGSGKHENPRVALIWETEEDDGSRRIFGLDLTTGEIEPVGSRPATPDPSELPQPPLTDEEVTMPTEPKTGEDTVVEGSTGTGNGNGNL